MDIPTVARDIIAFLACYAPFLKNLGEKTAEAAAKKAGEDGWGVAKKIWKLIVPHFKKTAAASAACEEYLEKPTDEHAQDAITVQLKRAIMQDTQLKEELRSLYSEGIVQKQIAEKGSRISNSTQEVVGPVAALQEQRASRDSVVEGSRQSVASFGMGPQDPK